MKIFFLVSEEQMIKLTDDGDETFEIHTFSDDYLEVCERDNPEIIILDRKREYGKDILDDVIKMDDRAPMILITAENRVVELSLEEDNSFENCRTLEDTIDSLLKHDLMNKVRLFKGSIQMLRDDYALPEAAKERLASMEKRIDSSIELIESITAHREKIDRSGRVIDPITPLEEVLDSMRYLLSESGFEVEVDVVERCDVIGGPLLKEVYSNIIENAMIHSGGDLMIVRAYKSSGGFTISFQDNGGGVPEEYKENIFEKGFTTGGESRTGLGLYLVKEIMEVFEGEVSVKDSELDGARFDLHLKKA